MRALLLVPAFVVLGLALYAVVTVAAARLIARRSREYPVPPEFVGRTTVIDFEAERRRRRREVELYDQEASPDVSPDVTPPQKERGAQ